MARKDEGLIVVYGTMFSGKTTELHRIIKNCRWSDDQTQLFKPFIDERFSTETSQTHDEEEFKAIPIKSLADLTRKLDKNADFYLFDEFQFFTSNFVPYIIDLVKEGKNVAVAGLPVNFRGETYLMNDYKGNESKYSIWNLVNDADKSVHLSARCQYKYPSNKKCGKKANYCQRFLDKDMKILAPYEDPVFKLGADDIYVAMCSEHFETPPKKKD
ncbi:MAG: hypothetical protein ABIB43_05970 [archaeon]